MGLARTVIDPLEKEVPIVTKLRYPGCVSSGRQGTCNERYLSSSTALIGWSRSVSRHLIVILHRLRVISHRLCIPLFEKSDVKIAKEDIVPAAMDVHPSGLPEKSQAFGHGVILVAVVVLRGGDAEWREVPLRASAIAAENEH